MVTFTFSMLYNRWLLFNYSFLISCWKLDILCDNFVSDEVSKICIQFLRSTISSHFTFFSVFVRVCERKRENGEDRETRPYCYNTALASGIQPEVVQKELGEPHDLTFPPSSDLSRNLVSPEARVGTPTLKLCFLWC